MEFEPVIGLEVHAQLKTKTKIFLCLFNIFRCSAQYPYLSGMSRDAGRACRC